MKDRRRKHCLSLSLSLSLSKVLSVVLVLLTHSLSRTVLGNILYIHFASKKLLRKLQQLA